MDDDMPIRETDLLDHIFENLAENDWAPDSEILDTLMNLSAPGKAEFVRRMDERYGVKPPQLH
ncbi:MAG: hypothetical protein HY847_04550 [Betaproteobacteria bacterium]|nr:hypothetical protein [Betaproteobacteria bacterium]